LGGLLSHLLAIRSKDPPKQTTPKNEKTQTARFRAQDWAETDPQTTAAEKGNHPFSRRRHGQQKNGLYPFGHPFGFGASGHRHLLFKTLSHAATN
jgi:hypothetical protein